MGSNFSVQAMGSGDMITVLAAAYNGKAYIRQQMDSILAQNRSGILLVVSDDCSSDGTGELLDEYAASYEKEKGQTGAGNRLLVIHRKQPSGGAARHFLELMRLMAVLKEEDTAELKNESTETAAAEAVSSWQLLREQLSDLKEAADAEYFMLSDQDDVWLPQKAEKLLTEMQRLEGKEAAGAGGPNLVDGAGGKKEKKIRPVLVHSDLQVTDENLSVIAPSFFKYQKISPERTRLSQLLVQNNITGGAVMFNRALLSYLKEIPRVCLMHDAWLALVASCFGTIGCVREPLYLYRQHSSNTLGAEKGDSLEGAGRRLADGSAARENYRKMFGQAGSMLEIFGEQLDKKQKETLSVFAGLGRRSRMEKMALILKYGFTKNTWLRTLGQMLFIGD